MEDSTVNLDCMKSSFLSGNLLLEGRSFFCLSKCISLIGKEKQLTPDFKDQFIQDYSK